MKKSFTYLLCCLLFILSKAQSQIITTVAGGTTNNNIPAVQASVLTPTGVAIDASGNIYISCAGDGSVKKINTSGIITTIAGGGSGSLIDGGSATNGILSTPQGVAVDAAGNVFVTEQSGHKIRKVSTSGIITTIAGTGTSGFSGDGGLATSAEIQNPDGIRIDANGNIFFADEHAGRVRKIDASGIITTVAGNGNLNYNGDNILAVNASLNPVDVALDNSGNVYIDDFANNRIRKVNASGIITTIAGTGPGGFSGDGGLAVNATLFFPYRIGVDANNNIYISDNDRIRKVSTNGIINTIAGTGVYGFSGDGGVAPNAKLSTPAGIATDVSGNLYFADNGNNRVREVNTGGIINTVAGNGVSYLSGSQPPLQTPVPYPADVAFDAAGNCFVVCNGDGSVRKVDTHGTMTTVAGGGTGTLIDGAAATSGALIGASGIAIDAAGNLYITEFSGCKIRKVTTAGIISTVAGTGTAGFSGDGGPAVNAQLYFPAEIKIDAAGNIFFDDLGSHRIRKINTSGIITTIAGTGTGGYNGDNIPATSAQLNHPIGLALDGSGNIYVADDDNSRVRKINTSGIITTIAGTGTGGYSGDGGLAITAQIGNPFGIAADLAGNIYVSCHGTDQRIRKISTNGIISTVAGTGVYGFSGDGGPAVDATIKAPWGMAFDGNNNLFIADEENHRVREIDTAGIINTIAGSGASNVNGDGYLATNAILYQPTAIFVDRQGNQYFNDSNRIRKIDAAGIVTTIAGTGTAGFSGDGQLANSNFVKINQPSGIYKDINGNIYIGSAGDNRIRKVDTAGIITTFAGNGTGGYSGDGGLATNASIQGLQGIAGDAAGNIYFTDYYNAVIRKINPSGFISTTAGTGIPGYSGDGGPATAAQISKPGGISIDALGNLYFGDHGSVNVVRKIDINGIISTVAGGSPTSGNAGDGGPATAALFADIEDAYSDATGNLYIVDGINNNVRRVNISTGVITNFAGTGSGGFSGDNGLAVNAQLNQCLAISQDTAGNFYIADAGNKKIRKVTVDYTLDTVNTTVIQFISQPVLTHINDNNFHRLLSILPSQDSSALLSGNVNFTLSFDTSVQTYNGNPYVTRHYDITPDSNAAAARATLTLYFSQSEFDAYNSYVIVNGLNLPLLPANGTDNGNIIVTQFHGSGSRPGNYTSSSVAILPSVLWSAEKSWWELTFPVDGFSGFYISTTNSLLPVVLSYFTGSLQNASAILNWQTVNETNTSFFTIQRSTDGVSFTSFSKVAATGSSTGKQYSYYDKTIQSLNAKTLYYRLQITDKNGTISYSQMVAIPLPQHHLFALSPNPAKDKITIHGERLSLVEIYDANGRLLITRNHITSDNAFISITHLSKGIYMVYIEDSYGNKQTEKMVIE